MNDLNKKTKSLNQSGAFLQFHILNELTKKYWMTSVETPVTVAPFVKHPEAHPLLYEYLVNHREILADKFPQAVLESQNQTMREETSIDIDAAKTIHIEFEHYNLTFRLCIEVKKNDPRYSDWCFFQQKINSEPMRVITKAITSVGQVNLFQISKTTNYSNPIFVQTNQYHHLDIFKQNIADFALALQNENVKNKYYKSEKTKVDEAARQIIKGTYGLIIDKVIHQVTTGTGYTHDRDVFIPIVVTNANLFLCKFNPRDIDSKSGHIKKDPKYEPVDSIVYEYPVPKEVQFPNTLTGNLDEDSKKHVLKWHVLIMSPKGFVKFLEKIDQIKGIV